MTAVRGQLAAASQGLGAISPAAGVLAAFATVAAEPTLQVWEECWRAHVARRSKVLLAEATVVAGLSEAELVDRVSADPPRLLLTAEIVQAGLATPMEEKVVLLGRALARIAPDDAQLDVERLTVRTLQRLEEPHVHVLAVLDRRVPMLPRVEDGQLINMTGWSPLSVGAALPQYRNAAGALLGVLESEGLGFNTSIASFLSPTGPGEVVIDEQSRSG